MKKTYIKLIACTTVITAILAGCGSGGSYNKAESTAAYNYSNEDNGYSYAEEAAAVEYDDDVYEYAESANKEVPAQSDSITDDDIATKTQRKLIRTVNLSAETKEFDSFIDNVEAKITQLGGYAQSVDISGNSYDSYNRRTAYIVARIPAENLDSFVGEVEGKSNITSKYESAEDVTLQYSDIESHIASLRIEQDRLNQLLEEAYDLDTIIALESRLTEVRYELESYESRIKTMDNQVTYSTVNLNVSEVIEYKPEVVEPITFGERLAQRFSESCADAWETIQDFIIGFIAFIPTLVVLLIMLGVLALVVFAIVKLITFIVKKTTANKSKTQRKNKKGAPVIASAVEEPIGVKEESTVADNTEE